MALLPTIAPGLLLMLLFFGCTGSSLWPMGCLLLRTVSLDLALGSVVVTLGLSCPVACGVLAPRPKTKPMSPALQGGFLTTGPPGKSLRQTFISIAFTVEFLINFESSEYEMMLYEQ